MKKVGKTTRPFTYDLNQISYSYAMKAANRFKRLGLIECLKNYGRRFVTLYQRQWSKPSPRKRNAKWLSKEAMAPHSSTLAWKIPWTEESGGLQSMGSRLRDFTFTFHFHALEKEMATHSCVLAWRIPGTVEPGRLPSMGSSWAWDSVLDWGTKILQAMMGSHR